jgi:hypothetical protein
MSEILMLSALGLAVLLLAGAVVWCLLDRSRAGEGTRATIDALDAPPPPRSSDHEVEVRVQSQIGRGPLHHG